MMGTYFKDTLLLVVMLAPIGAGGSSTTSPARVYVKTVEVHRLAGELESLSSDGGLVLRQGEQRHDIALHDVVRVDFAATADRESLNPMVWLMTNGDKLLGMPINNDGDGIVVDVEGVGPVPVALETIAQMDMPSALSTHNDTLAWFRRQPLADEDQILLANGDVIRGFILSIGPHEVVVDTDAGQARLARRLLVSLRLANPSAQQPRPTVAVVHLVSGVRLSVASITYKNGTARAMLATGQKVGFAVGQIRSIEVVGGRWQYLSDRKPDEYVHTPMLSVSWPYVQDRNVRGQPLSVAGNVYDKGIGVHSAARLVYHLSPADRHFVTYFGMDDDSGPAADVLVVVRTDGQERFRQEHVRPGRLWGPVRLDLSGAKTLELLVEFGDNGGVQDRLNWIEPAIIR